MKTLDSEILREIGALSRCIQYISNLSFKKIELQTGQFIFLTRICEHCGINQSDLTAMLKVDKTTTAKAVQKLVEADYVTKRRDESDKRMWRLYPTERAWKNYDFIIEEENRHITACLRGFSEKDRHTVEVFVQRMRENIEKDWEKARHI